VPQRRADHGDERHDNRFAKGRVRILHPQVAIPLASPLS
jgi:hypothetical protein